LPQQAYPRRIAAALGATRAPLGCGRRSSQRPREPHRAPVIIGDYGARNALAWICRRLERICRQLDGSRDLVLELGEERRLPDIVMRAAEHRLTPYDLTQLELLRKGLDGISPPRAWAVDDRG